MVKEVPIIFMMFAIIISSLIMVYAVAVYYGGDWTWIAQQNASMFLVLTVLGLAFFTLVAWIKRRH